MVSNEKSGLTNSGRRFSKPSCPKMSIGNSSRRSHLPSGWPSSRVSPRSPAYTIRVKAPYGEKLMHHKHPEDRVYTVISGVFYIGLGDEFDASKLEAYPPGAVIILPGNTPHFHWAKSGEYVTQITAMGPLGLEYLSTKDDPRNNSDRRNSAT
jgi:quercetin dioxygenase-like cupin family protein